MEYDGDVWHAHFLFEVRLQMFTCITDLNVIRLAVTRAKWIERMVFSLLELHENKFEERIKNLFQCCDGRWGKNSRTEDNAPATHE